MTKSTPSQSRCDGYETKLAAHIPHTLYAKLSPQEQEWVQRVALSYQLTRGELTKVVEITIDLRMWQVNSANEEWQRLEKEVTTKPPARKKRLLKGLEDVWVTHKQQDNRYLHPTQEGLKPIPLPKASPPTMVDSGGKIFGRCPVASPKTLCCNLRTIDVVQNCGHGCTYCSIQTFYNREIKVEENLAAKLASVQLDPQRLYHFGTGQASDSLLWGNIKGVLTDVVQFARQNPNVLLEFKTKSQNVAPVLAERPPRNVFCSWSLNPDPIIHHEERGTVSLERRLKAARRMADAGYVVGFHFHPIVWHQGWEEAYAEVTQKVVQLFKPEEIAYVSLGTLTYIKPVMKELRAQGLPSKILKMPLEEAAGKWSYPVSVKKKLFSHVYECLRPWHGHVFFYLCMEDRQFWHSTFAFEYDDNESFERAMCSHLKAQMDARPPLEEQLR